MARGFDTVLVSHSGDNPLSYIPPLLMLLQMVSVTSSLAARTGVRFTALLLLREEKRLLTVHWSLWSSSVSGLSGPYGEAPPSVLADPIKGGHCSKYMCKRCPMLLVILSLKPLSEVVISIIVE